ncbi:hypothetical protein FPV67DRAFT_1675656 [Lyophyllum atratum]|nr:hypothetical protein FPV67DRAFT_1675656 [Lyophyllum atratum]
MSYPHAFLASSPTCGTYSASSRKVDRVEEVALGEYSRGYAGEHMSHFPQVEQRSGNLTTAHRLGLISMAQATPSIVQGPYYRPPIPHIRTTATTPYVPTFDPLAAKYAALHSARKAAASSPAATRIRRRLQPATASSLNRMTSLPSTSTSATPAPASTSTTTAKFSALPPQEKKLVQYFVSGRGILSWGWEAMWEKCGLCGDVFLNSTFAVRPEECRGIELD